MLTAIAIPEQLATAKLAGFKPEAGLLAFLCAGAAFALFGRNRFLSVGADSTIAPIFAGGVAAIAGTSGGYGGLASAVALVSGVLLIIVGLARAGWIADLLSRPVTVGILAGISVHIIVSQLPALLSVSDGQGSLLARLGTILGETPQANLYALCIGIGVLIVTLAAARISEKIPGALLALAGAAAAYSLLHLGGRGVSSIGALHVQFPSPALPAVQGPAHALAIFPLSVIIAAVCIVQTSAVVRAFPSEKSDDEDAAPDFAAVGLGSVLSGLFGSFAVDASPPRTAAVAESGGKSQLSTVTALVLVAAVAIFFSNATQYVPNAALAGILIFIAFRIFRLQDMMNVARFSRREFWLLLASALLVIVLPIETGMGLAIALSLIHGVTLVMWPTSTKLVHKQGSTVWWPPTGDPGESEIPGVLVFSPAAPLNFTNTSYIHRQLLAALQSEAQPVKLLVIEASGVTDVDYTASQTAQQTIRELRAAGTDVALTRLISQHAQQRAAQSGLIAAIGADRVFQTVQEAIDALARG